MFPLSCVRVQTGRETSARKKNWSAQQFSFKKCLCTYFIHVIANSDEFRSNVAQKKFYAHTDFKKLEGTLVPHTHAGYYKARNKKILVYRQCSKCTRDLPFTKLC